ncbi:MAG: flavohemoglobin expression-modulating QEGLA motif protein, partial [Cellulophaga sp.]|nr:flavohemoglobin expression-modulating QEGLA motif protein [Cellulophaga sp.]
KYKLNRDDAFAITMRVHRGGGFTKDRLYLSGLKKIYKRYRREESMDNLLTGKVTMDYEADIEHLQQLGLASPITHHNIAFAKNENENKTLDFILNHLK